MKILHELHLFCLAVIIELTAELLTDTVRAQILMGGMLVLMFIAWFRQRYPHFPFKNPWDDDDDWL